MANKCTKEEFVEKAKKVHGNRYDYSKVEYINSTTKIEIVCRLHGSFWQSPNKHLCPRHCPKCASLTQRRKKRLSLEEVLEKFKSVHGDKYEYPEFVYKSIRQNIDIICPIHGVFNQQIFGHAQGKGCKQCGIDKISAERRKYTKEEFVDHCNKIHNHKYDYSKIKEYKSAQTKITIGCPIHGYFKQSTQAHYSGHGCPECGIIERWYVGGFGDKVEYYVKVGISEEPCYIYFVELKVQDQVCYKVGITTAKNPEKRFSSIKCESKASELKPLFKCLTTLTEAHKIEQHIKNHFYDYRHKPITRFYGWTECVSNINPECVIDEIKEKLNEQNPKSCCVDG